MAFSGGVYTLPTPALVPGQTVSSSENNTVRNDMAASFNLTFLRNGTSTATANLPMGGYKLTGLGVATTLGDALSYNQAAVVSNLTDTALTITRVPYVSTGGLLIDSASFTFDGTTLTAGGFSTSGNIAAATASISGNITVTGGTANGVTYLNGSKVLTSGSALQFDGSNLGLGVTPSAWYSGDKAFQIGARGALVGQSTATLLAQNWYADASNVSRYIGSDYASLYNQYSGQHVWYTAPSGTAGNAISFTQAMTLDASGNLGIGITSPGTYGKIETYGSGYVGIATQSSGGAVGVLAANSSSEVRVGAVSNHPVLFMQNTTERMRIDSSGNVGIGTSSPTFPLTVKANSSANAINIVARTGDDYGILAFRNAANSSEWASLWSGTNYMAMYTAGNERMRIDSSGNLLVGTTSALGKITCRGSSGITIASSLDSGTGGDAYYGNVYATGQYLARWEYRGSMVGAITTNGTNTTYGTSSDYRLKENIQPMQGALDVVAQLKPVTYNWKADGSDGQGFIAHELQAVVPDCVTGEKDAVDAEGKPVYQGIDTSFLVATLTAAIKELKAELDATKAEVAALKGN